MGKGLWEMSLLWTGGITPSLMSVWGLVFKAGPMGSQEKLANQHEPAQAPPKLSGQEPRG